MRKGEDGPRNLSGFLRRWKLRSENKYFSLTKYMDYVQLYSNIVIAPVFSWVKTIYEWKKTNYWKIIFNKALNSLIFNLKRSEHNLRSIIPPFSQSEWNAVRWNKCWHFKALSSITNLQTGGKRENYSVWNWTPC